MTTRMTSAPLVLWIPLALCLLHYALSGVAASSQSELQSDIKAEDVTKKERARRASSFVRIGKPSNFVRIGRPNSFVRIGKDVEGDDGGYGDLDNYEAMEKRPSSFVRIGKRHPMHRFIRIGRLAGSQSLDNTYADLDKRQSNFVRIGKADSYPMEDDGDFYDKRASSFVRIGKSDSDRMYLLPEILKRASHFVRIGKSPSSFVRIGRNPTGYEFPEDALDKRANSFVRIGKDLSDSLQSPYDFESDDFAKRAASSFLRIGKSYDDDKRASSFVRIGKNAAADDDENVDSGSDDKRSSSFVRIGKSDTENRLSDLMEMDKTPTSTNDLASSSSSKSVSSSSEEVKDGGALTRNRPISLANRGSAFVRIGKIPHSAFVRIGKNTDVLMDPLADDNVAYRRGSRGGQSNFVRIG